MALAGAGIEQDAGYWEWHINKVPEGTKIMFGVAHKKDRSFYNELEKGDEGRSAVLTLCSVMAKRRKEIDPLTY